LKNGIVVLVDFTRDHNTLIKTLIHELVHVKQFIDKRLIKVDNDYYFEGVIYTCKDTYRERPFEVEAFETSELIYNQIRWRLF